MLPSRHKAVALYSTKPPPASWRAWGGWVDTPDTAFEFWGVEWDGLTPSLCYVNLQ